MMQLSCSLISCGIQSLHNLQGGVAAFKAFLKRDMTEGEKYAIEVFPGQARTWRTPRQYFIPGFMYLFSDTTSGPGNEIAKFIKDNNLGEIVQVGPFPNKNTGFTRISMWYWTYNGNRIKAASVPQKKVGTL